MIKVLTTTALGAVLLAGVSHARKGNAMDAKVLSVADQIDSFKLPRGFKIELVSSEKEGAIKPISIAFDDAGRLWTQTASEYPQDKNAEKFAAGGKDKILVFKEPWARGPHKPHVFADGLVMPVSVLPHDDGVYMVHGPDIEFLKDTDGDGKADSRKKLVTGFGIQDTHTTVHQLTRTPGGWINFSQGCNAKGTITMANGKTQPFNGSLIGRMNEKGTKVEKIGAGMNNIWTWEINDEGRTFIHEANDLGYSQAAFDRDANYPSFVRTKVHADAPLHPPTAEGLGLGGTGFSGIANMEDTTRGFPKEWQGVNFVANPITGSINAVRYERNEDGVYEFKKLKDFLTSNDPMFRPVAITVGPDGALYVIDWYNRIISHNELPVDHPARDKESGRIWRISHQSQKATGIPNVEKATDEMLIRHLISDNNWEARAAWHQIGKRQVKSAIPKLKLVITRPNFDDGQRVMAIWAMEALGYFDLDLWKTMLKSKNENVRFEAIRALSSLKPPAKDVDRLLKVMAKDSSFYVRNEVVRYYRDLPRELSSEQRELLESMVTAEKDLPNKKVKGWKGQYLRPGGSYEPVFLNFLVDKALNKEVTEEEFDETPYNKFIAEHPQRSTEDEKALYANIHRLTQLAESSEGDVVKGKQHYESRCNACHNQTGTGFAPALNGGKARAHEALLTAILDPNAAAEEVFYIYRVVKKDGSVMEGFRSSISEEGIEFTHMGGSTLVVPLEEIKDAGYIKGKSVMLENMSAGLSDQDMVDLLTYIRTID